MLLPPIRLQFRWGSLFKLLCIFSILSFVSTSHSLLQTGESAPSPWGTIGVPHVRPSPPAPPIDLVATPGTGLVSLSWSASAGATSYNVKRGTTSGGAYQTIATSVTDTPFSDASVIGGTPYYYVVSAVGSITGEGGNSNEASATPKPSVAIPPPPPTQLTVISGNAQSTLSWSASSDAATASAPTFYSVKRAILSGGP